MLPNIYTNVKRGDKIQFQAYDKDVVTSDFIGQTSLIQLLKFSGDAVISHDLDLFDRKGKKSGVL